MLLMLPAFYRTINGREQAVRHSEPGCIDRPLQLPCPQSKVTNAKDLPTKSTAKEETIRLVRFYTFLMHSCSLVKVVSFELAFGGMFLS
jgi:hypothetical protein